jgi:hypothetical protein
MRVLFDPYVTVYITLGWSTFCYYPGYTLPPGSSPKRDHPGSMLGSAVGLAVGQWKGAKR